MPGHPLPEPASNRWPQRRAWQGLGSADSALPHPEPEDWGSQCSGSQYSATQCSATLHPELQPYPPNPGQAERAVRLALASEN